MAQNSELIVQLRPVQRSDAPAITRLLESDEEGISWTGRIPWPFRLADANAWLDTVLDGPGTFAIEVAGEFAGCAGAREDAEPGSVQVGYWVGKQFRSKGVATRALGLLLEHARERGFRRFTAWVFPGNEASVRILTKHGFRCIRETEVDVPLRGGLRRSLHFELELTEPAPSGLPG